MAIRTTFLVQLFTLASLATAGSACSDGGGSRQPFVDRPDPTQPTGDGSSGGSSGSSGTPAPQPEKPGCAQAAYTEALPTNVSLSDLSYSPAQAQAYLLSALSRRYPIGKSIVEGGVSSPLAAQQGNCVNRFLDDTSTPASVLKGAATVVHECGHLFDLGEAKGAADSSYVLRPDLRFACTGGDTTSRGGKTFARSRIKGDGFYAKRKACGGKAGQGCDFYADVYLDGNPDDAKFEGGDQGYSSVLEETTQYVNSLATALAFKESYGGGKSSERDGILTFLWYVERYLAMAKSDYPDAYDALANDACWRQATLSVWDRAWFYLDATSGMDELGIDDGALEPLVKDPALTAQIDALRKLECQ